MFAKHHQNSIKKRIILVPDERSGILEVVVVRRILVGYWEFGVGRE
jgi:hypothetical protein